MSILDQTYDISRLENEVNIFSNMFKSLVEEVKEKDKEITSLKEVIASLKETIADLQQYLIPPKFKKGDVVKVLGFEDNLFMIDDFVCYDLNHPVYNLYAINDPNNFETISQIDLISTEIK